MGTPRFPLREEFRAWLGEFHTCAAVGYVGEDHRCPLATWLASLYGRAVVGMGTVLLGEHSYLEVELSAWAARFVQIVDGEAGNEVTARRALEILEEVGA